MRREMAMLTMSWPGVVIDKRRMAHDLGRVEWVRVHNWWMVQFTADSININDVPFQSVQSVAYPLLPSFGFWIAIPGS